MSPRILLHTLAQIGSGRSAFGLGKLLFMQITPFRIEEYMGKYEFSAKYLLSSSDAESQSIGELLELEPGAHDAFLKLWCGYTESPGAPWLREVLARIYEQIRPDHLVVVSAAEEAIFLFYHVLLASSDHAIVETPCYESALTVPRSTGAAVTEWRRKPENSWAHDVEALERLIRPNTRAIYINTPHNPTGLLMQPRVFRRVLELAAHHGIYVFCDEVYRELEHDPTTRLPAACDFYERALSLGSVSKTYRLAGTPAGMVGVSRRCISPKADFSEALHHDLFERSQRIPHSVGVSPSSEIHPTQFANRSG